MLFKRGLCSNRLFQSYLLFGWLALLLGKLISVSLRGEKSWLDMLSFLVEKTLVSETKTFNIGTSEKKLTILPDKVGLGKADSLSKLAILVTDLKRNEIGSFIMTSSKF